MNLLADFIFGLQGWSWGEQRPTGITFFLDGTCRVNDQHGRPIKGVVQDGKAVYFGQCSHAQTIAALAAERVDWLALVRAGWPQLPYDKLKELKEVPPTPAEELRKIRDPQLRKDALRLRRETDEQAEKELRAAQEE